MLYPVVNAEAFNKGKIDKFDEVGFRVLDDRTLQITLSNPTPYFPLSSTITPGFLFRFPPSRGTGRSLSAAAAGPNRGGWSEMDRSRLNNGD